MKAKKALPKKTPHGAEALLDAETTLRDQRVEALFRSPQGAPPHSLAPTYSLAHDPVAVTAAKHVAVGFAGVSLVCQDALRFGSIDHGRTLGGFRPCWLVLCEPW